MGWWLRPWHPEDAGSDRFPKPGQVPTTWVHLAHHVTVAASWIGVAVFVPGQLPSLALTFGMFLYADAYSAVLHAFFDKPEALSLPALGHSAQGFQMHHDHPIASTRDQGLYRLFSDTVKIQWITGSCALMFASHTALTLRVVALKWAMCAYGTQLAHYWSHSPPSERPLYVRVLQRCHILLPQQHHRVHHQPPYNRNFGIVSGLCNPLLDPMLRGMPFRLLFALWTVLTLFDVTIIQVILCRLPFA
ncbi:unnamed protein product [Prorocentrum cordatum]|uniref:Lipid desaturase domain-containing protein n=1 Tax=Prorocentrum cordatum TaxID=2364126 RepID=A0ABN9T0A6_9DINO|nr:unnamed protein product [Polarella glacialis]